MIIAISITLLFIVLRFTVTLFNFISNPKLTRVNRPYADLVSILITARNEADNILTLLQSIKNQDYKHYEVIIYDDCSTDATYTVCREYATANPGFRVIKGSELPLGWSGKNYACYQLAQQAKGEYFLFADADTVFHKNLLNSAIHRMQLYQLGLLSLFPNQTMLTIGENLTIPLLHYLLLNLLPLRAVFLFKNAAVSTASGQFMLFAAGSYRQNQWHHVVKDKLAEDTTIMKQVKSAGYKAEVLLANGMISSRIYTGYLPAVKGLGKNLSATFNYSVMGLLLYLLVVIGGPLLVICTLNLNLIFFMSGLILLSRVMISLSAGQNTLYNLVLHPLQMISLALIAFLAIQRQLTQSAVWKGRRV